MKKEMKYYYYISKSKIDMLFGQLTTGRLTSKIGSKFTAPGIEVNAELNSQNRKSLLGKTVYVVKQLEKRNKIIDISENENLETGEYYHNHGFWHSGIMGTDDSELSFPRYLVWKTIGSTLIILIGSPTNILGQNENYINPRFAPSSHESVGYMMDFAYFIQQIFGTSIISRKLDKKFDQNMLDLILSLGVSRIEQTPFDKNKSMPDSLYGTPSRALAMGLLCLLTMKDLPNTDLELVFKKFYLTEMNLPEDLSIWISQLKELTSEGENVEEFDHVRRVLLGTPLYVVIK